MYDKYRALEPERSHDDAVANTILETLLASWEYEGGVSYKELTTTSAPPGKPWSPDHPSKTRETLIRSIIWYLDHFKDDPAKTVVLANGKPAVELSFKMQLDYGPGHGQKPPMIAESDKNYEVDLRPDAINYVSASGKAVEYTPSVPMNYVLCGHLDRVVEFTGGTYVMDRKTSSSTIGSAYFDQYSPDNQMSLYTMAAKVIYQTPVKGVIIDAVQIAVGFSRFSRGFTYRTDSEIEEWLANTRNWLRIAEGYASNGFWPMNDKACHHYGGCVFRKVCSKSPEVRQRFLESDFVKNPWNPLVPR